MPITCLQQMALFSHASANSIQALSQFSKRNNYKKNNIILESNQSDEFFLYVINGWTKVFKESADGEEIILDVLTQDQYCGEIFVFNSDSTERYRAQAICEAEILIIPLEILRKVLLSDPKLALDFLQKTFKKQQHLNMSMEHLSIQNAAQRIGCFILRQCRELIAQKANISFVLPYDKTLLALRLGMRPETFSRALNKLKKECNINIKGECVEIDKLGKLVLYVCRHCSKIYPCNEERF